MGVESWFKSSTEEQLKNMDFFWMRKWVGDSKSDSKTSSSGCLEDHASLDTTRVQGDDSVKQTEISKIFLRPVI